MPGEGEVLVKVSAAGICNTDLEIIGGYIPDFKGILGHEFFGYIEESDDTFLRGKRVTAEINIPCLTCDMCMNGGKKHCKERKALGIRNRDGAMAEYITVPIGNIHLIPESVSDKQAVFIEPLAAALEVTRFIPTDKEKSVLIIGDGKLALLITMAVSAITENVTVVGKYPDKLAFLNYLPLTATLLKSFRKEFFDVVIEASGSPSGFELALSCVKPGGICVLKSTYKDNVSFNPSNIVRNEFKIVGSRCGDFKRAIDFILLQNPPLESLISGEFAIKDAIEAFRYASEARVLKVVLSMKDFR